jgi:hypothetical protein
LFSIFVLPNQNKPYYTPNLRSMSKNWSTWIGCFSIVAILLLGVLVPVQFSDARYKDDIRGDIVIQDLFNECNYETGCQNIGAVGEDGSAIAQIGGLQAGTEGAQGPPGETGAQGEQGPPGPNQSLQTETFTTSYTVPGQGGIFTTDLCPEGTQITRGGYWLGQQGMEVFTDAPGFDDSFLESYSLGVSNPNEFPAEITVYVECASLEPNA